MINISTLLNDLTGQVRRENLKSAGHKNIDRLLLIQQPFFRDELVWLYNERALISFIQGRLFDAYPLFGQALKLAVGEVKVGDPVSYRASNRRIELNQALVDLERGSLKNAQENLETLALETQLKGKGYTDSIINIYAIGYLALCHHLGDNFKAANRGYKEAIEKLRNLNEARGVSIFLCHRADLLRAKAKSKNDDKYLKAIEALNESEQIAQSIRAVDLQNYALIARARLLRDMKNRPVALENLRNAERYARSMGNQKMLT